MVKIVMIITLIPQGVSNDDEIKDIWFLRKEIVHEITIPQG